MEPFRNLLSKNSDYVWTPSLQESFETAKKEIVKLVEHGVKSFATDQWICLITDWSKHGIGYAMWQKRCTCTKIHPTCCPTGWVIISCASRFCTAAESRYHPIEGELLGVTWALQKSAYYTLGAKKLLVLVDHKPLLGLLTKGEVGAIENPRLSSLAEKTLRWNFEIRHVAGAQSFGPDALSRYPGDTKQVHKLRGMDLAGSKWS